MWQLGDKIIIRFMKGEPNYTNKTGYITEIAKDPWGNEYLSGTWGSLKIYESDGDIIEKING